MAQPVEPSPVRTSGPLIACAVVAQVIGLAAAFFCYFLATLMTYGLYSWTEPTLDSGVWLPILGFSVSLGLGAWVMCLGPHRRRWLWVAIVTTVVGAVGLSLITWVSVLLA